MAMSFCCRVGCSRYAAEAKVFMRCKLVCFDVDGTLIDEVVYIWQLIHKGLGIDKDTVDNAARRFYEGRISFREWADHDMRLWVKKGATRQVLLSLIEGLKLMPGARETLDELKRRGLKLAVISGGLDFVLERFIPDAGTLFDRIMINRIAFDRKGRIERIEPTEFGSDSHKIDGLRQIAKELGVRLGECAFVGDSDNDISIAEGAGLSIGFRPSARLAKACDVVIRNKDLREVLAHIR